MIVGAAHRAGNAPRSKTNAKGYVRGFDVKTGKRLWIFHTIPQPGEFGNDTWEKDSWSYYGQHRRVGASSRSTKSSDIVYLPVELSTGDYYGGHRPGQQPVHRDRSSRSICRPGKRNWHFQLVHHGIWDYDMPCAPILADITVDGRRIKAVAQPTKQGFLYVFDRQTGRTGLADRGTPGRTSHGAGREDQSRRSRFRPSLRRSSFRAFRKRT